MSYTSMHSWPWEPVFADADSHGRAEQRRRIRCAKSGNPIPPDSAIAAVVHNFRHCVPFDHSMRLSAVITPNEFQGGKPLSEIRLVSLELPPRPCHS
jgi:hypothetical protein